jgi:hypothetical protein
MEAGKNSVIYMGLISGPNKEDDTCGRTTVTGTMDRGFTVFHSTACKLQKYCGFLYENTEHRAQKRPSNYILQYVYDVASF